MLLKKYLNLQLLSAASILLMTSANGSPIFAQRHSSTSATSTSNSSVSPVLTRPTVNLNDVTIPQLDEIHRNTANIQKQLNRLSNKNRLIKLLSLVAVGQAIYIINDKDIGGIATTIKKECNTRYQQLLNVIETLRKGSAAQTPAESKNEVAQENKSSVVDEQKNKTEHND